MQKLSRRLIKQELGHQISRMADQNQDIINEQQQPEIQGSGDELEASELAVIQADIPALTNLGNAVDSEDESQVDAMLALVSGQARSYLRQLVS